MKGRLLRRDMLELSKFTKKKKRVLDPDEQYIIFDQNTPHS